VLIVGNSLPVTMVSVGARHRSLMAVERAAQAALVNRITIAFRRLVDGCFNLR
jgi:hypothetical protein